MNTEQSSCSAPVGVELRMVLELEQEFEVAADTQLFRQASPGGDIHGLRASRMAAAAVGPVQRPEPLGGERCCTKSSPRSLKISREKARCRTPRPSWHSDLLKWPSRRSSSSTTISASESGIMFLSSIRSAGPNSSITVALARPRLRRRSSADHSVMRNGRASLRLRRNPPPGGRPDRYRVLGGIL